MKLQMGGAVVLLSLACGHAHAQRQHRGRSASWVPVTVVPAESSGSRPVRAAQARSSPRRLPPESEISGRDEVMAVLKGGALGDTRGFSEHLRAFARQSFEGVWLTGLHIAARGQDVALEGRALRAEQVPGYLRRLNSESVMQGHPFSELLMQAPAADPGDKSGGRPSYIEFRLATKPETPAAKARRDERDLAESRGRFNALKPRERTMVLRGGGSLDGWWCHDGDRQ